MIRPSLPVSALLAAAAVVAASAAAAAPAAPSPAPAPPAVAAPSRKAEAVLADFAAAIGGPAAFKRHKTIRLKREIQLKGMGIRGTEERWGMAGGKTLSVSSIPGMGTFRQGSNGQKHWAEDPINGLRLLSGAEAEQARIDATWGAELQLARLYRQVRSVDPPVPPPAGRRYECVELIGKLVKPAVACFDAETHLRVLQKGMHSTPQGEVPYTVTFGDYREVDGVKIAFSEEITAGPMNMQGTLVEVKLGEPLDPKLFQVPRAPSRKD